MHGAKFVKKEIIMSEVLFINACTRQKSRTLDLALHLLGKFKGNLQRVDLYDMKLLPLDEKGVERRQKAAEREDFSDEEFNLAKQFAGADVIVIAAPYWDLMFPAVLRTYLETICVAGLTFRYSAKGAPVGLCNAKQVYYVTTSGGFIGEYNLGFNYVKTLSQQLFGIDRVECISAEGLDVNPCMVDEVLKKTKEKMKSIYEN